MNRRTIAILFTVALLALGVGSQATAHTVNYSVGEQGTLDCGNPGHQPAESYIVAQAHHKHKLGSENALVHYPADGAWRASQIGWEVVVTSYWLSRQSGWGFSTSSSWAGCT